jgi:hypothetical protein
MCRAGVRHHHRYIKALHAETRQRFCFWPLLFRIILNPRHRTHAYGQLADPSQQQYADLDV